MARLSDFTAAPVARNLAAEALVAANAGKVHRNIVNWRGTHIVETLGAVECFGRDAAMAVTRRTRLHGALDRMMCRMNKTQDDGVRLHAALDRLLDSGKEPEESEDEEPEEEGEDEPHVKVRIPYDELSLDELQKSLDKAFGLDSDDHARVIVMDSDSKLRLGEPDDNAGEALGKFGIGFNVNTRARLPWFETMMSWIAKYPKETKIKDLHQPTLKNLLHELQAAA
jgi:hypothetical protein